MVVLSSIVFLLMAAALGLIIHGRYVWDAVLLSGVALLMLAGMGLYRWRSSAREPISLKLRMPQDWLAWSRWGALVLSAAIAFSVRGKPLEDDFTGLFMWWVLAVGVFAGSGVYSLLTATNLSGRLQAPLIVLPQTAASLSHEGRGEKTLTWAELCALLILMIFAFAVRAWAVGRIPENVGGDEGTQLVAALDMFSNGLRNPFGTGWYSVPTLSFLIPGGWMKVFGATIASGRMLSVCAGTLTVLTTWLLAKAMSGKRAAWVAASVMAVSAYHIHFSRLASNQIADPLVGTLVLWLVWLAVFKADDVQHQRVLWGFAGMAAGFGWYFYFGARWVSVLIAAFALWRTLVDRNYLKQHWWGMVRFLAGWAVVVLPLLGWYSRYPSPLTERYNAVSIFASGWLENEVGITGKSALTLVLEQVWYAFSAWHITPDRAFWYRPEQPLADVVTGALMLVGVLASLWQWRKKEHGVTLVWFTATTVMAWAFTLSNPSSQRGLLLVPAVALFVAWGSEAISEGFARWRKWFLYAIAVMLAVSAVMNLVFYFAVYTPRRTYGNPTAEIGTELANWMLENADHVCTNLELGQCEGMVVFMGPPWMYWKFGPMAFMLRDFEGYDVDRGLIPADVTSPARFVFVYERVEQLDGVRASYPGGETYEVLAEDGRVLAVVYDY